MALSADTRHMAGFVLDRNQQVKEARSLTIKVDGLAELSAATRALGRDAQRDLREGLKRAMDPVAREASAIAPRRTGRLAASLKPFVRGNAVGIRSPLPYANVIHWGGSTGRGHRPGVEWSGSIFVRPSLFISHAIDKQETQILESVERVMGEHASRIGWIPEAGVSLRLTQ